MAKHFSKCHNEEFKNSIVLPIYKIWIYIFLSALLELHKWTGPPEQVKLARFPALSIFLKIARLIDSLPNET